MGSSQIKPFIPRRLLRGGHVQTLASFVLPRRFSIRPPEERFVEVEPGIKVLCYCHWQADRRNALTLIVVHGLEGSSDSQYMLGLTQKGLAAGLNVIRMNQRNCGGTDSLAATLYHSGRSYDVAAVAKTLTFQEGLSRIALAGFSMGGNLVLKCAGEWDGTPPVQLAGVAAVCPSIDPGASADALHLPANRLYELYFLWKLRGRFRAKARLFPGVYDGSRLRGIRSLREFDDRITAYYCGFAGATDYYSRAAGANVIDRIAVPTLILHAANDPFIRILPETRRKIAQNSHIQFVETADGGHCSFLGQRDGDDGNWAECRIIEFLKAL